MSHHPCEMTLMKYANGELAAGASIATSVHIEHCAECRAKVEAFQARAAQEVFAEQSTLASAESAQILDALMAALPDAAEMQNTVNEPAEKVVRSVEVEDQTFRIPRVLGKVASEGLKWRRLPGGISQAALTLDSESICSFLYMKPGGKIPVHTHDGEELTLVLDGSFSDEMGTYRKGDLVVRNAEHNHSSRSDEGCLCFTVQDHPVIFTKGLPRLMNPISQHLFGN